MNKFEVALALMKSDEVTKLEMITLLDRANEIIEILDYDNLDHDIQNNLVDELRSIQKTLKQTAEKMRLNKFNIV